MKKIATFIYLVILMCLGATANQAMADFQRADIAYGYSNCKLTYWINRNSRAEVTIAFKPAAGKHGERGFGSRGLMITTYSDSGEAQMYPIYNIYMNGALFYNVKYYSNYNVYYHFFNSAWYGQEDFTAKVIIDFPPAILDRWPAIAIGAVNVGYNLYLNSSDIVAYSKGVVYLTLGSSTGCKVISNPSAPPPEDINITVTAPDWNVGEIIPGQQHILLGSSAEQFCLKYTGSSVAAKQFIINATSQNGIKNNRYQMRNSQDVSQEIPYQVSMTGVKGETVTLPNTSKEAVTLNDSGSTCFTPTFITMAPENLEPGLYTDVLTFNIVTKA